MRKKLEKYLWLFLSLIKFKNTFIHCFYPIKILGKKVCYKKPTKKSGSRLYINMFLSGCWITPRLSGKAITSSGRQEDLRTRGWKSRQKSHPHGLPAFFRHAKQKQRGAPYITNIYAKYTKCIYVLLYRKQRRHWNHLTFVHFWNESATPTQTKIELKFTHFSLAGNKAIIQNLPKKTGEKRGKNTADK